MTAHTTASTAADSPPTDNADRVPDPLAETPLAPLADRALDRGGGRLVLVAGALLLAAAALTRRRWLAAIEVVAGAILLAVGLAGRRTDPERPSTTTTGAPTGGDAGRLTDDDQDETGGGAGEELDGDELADALQSGADANGATTYPVTEETRDESETDDVNRDPRASGDDPRDPDLSETATAAEPGEAAGPEPEQSQPAQTEGTEPEASPPEDVSSQDAREAPPDRPADEEPTSGE